MSPASTPSSRRLQSSARLAGVCAVLLATLGGALTSCGSSKKSGTEADPATAVPAAAGVYAGATVRPTGSQKTAAQDTGRALTHQNDPYLRLLGALQTPGSPKLDFAHDVEPWLGPHAGVFLSSLNSSSSLLSSLSQSLLGGSAPSAYPFAGGAAQGAIVMDTSDAGKAESFLKSQAAHAGAQPRSYRGISFEVTAGGLAFGLVDHFAVIGSEAGLHGVIDTTLGGAPLSSTGPYSKLLAAAPSQAIAHVYFNPTLPGGPAPAPSSPGSAPEGLSGLLALAAGTRQANVSVVPSASSLALDVDTLASSSSTSTEGLLSSSPKAVRAFGELPGESWLAVGLGHVGTNLARDVQGLRSVTSLGSSLGGASGEGASSSSFGIKPLLEALTAPLGVLGTNTAQARRDFASWMGSAGIFASGGSLLELKAAVVIESTNAARSQAAVAKLAGELGKGKGSVAPASIPGTNAAIAVRLPGLPVVLYIANGRGSGGHTKYVLGLGEASVKSALNPPSTMSASATRSAGAAALGEGIEPSLFVDFPTLLSLLEGLGLTEAPEFAPVVPYLRAATTLAGGGHPLSGEVERYRLVLGLHQPAG